MLTIQDLINAGIELYNPIIKVWDKAQQAYIKSCYMNEDVEKEYRNIPICAIYSTPRSRFHSLSNPKVIIEVSINNEN